MQLEVKVGPNGKNGDGTFQFARSGSTGEVSVGDVHGRFYEAAIRGTLFSTGMTLTSIAAATFTTGTLGATATPIIGVWNPPNSGFNLIVLQAKLTLVQTAATVTGPGAFMWATGVNQSGISTGLLPMSRLSLLNTGSVAKGFANTALTGLSGNLTVQEASALFGGPMGNFSEVGTASGFAAPNGGCPTENFDGSIIVAPGNIIALLCTTQPVAISAASGLIWEEVKA